MSAPRVLFPDAVATFVGGLATAIAPVPVRANVQNPRDPKFVRLVRVGGYRLNVITDRVRISVEGWASTKGAAEDVTQLARMELAAMRDSAIGGVLVYRFDEVSGPVDHPDPTSGQERFTYLFEADLRGVEQ